MCLFTSEVRQRLLSPCRIFALSCFKGSFTERLRIIVLRGLILSLMHLGLIVGDEFRQKKELDSKNHQGVIHIFATSCLRTYKVRIPMDS